MRNKIKITILSFGDTGTGTVGLAAGVYGRCCCFFEWIFDFNFVLCSFNLILWATPSVCCKTLGYAFFMPEPKHLSIFNWRRFDLGEWGLNTIYYCPFFSVLIKSEEAGGEVNIGPRKAKDKNRLSSGAKGLPDLNINVWRKLFFHENNSDNKYE